MTIVHNDPNTQPREIMGHKKIIWHFPKVNTHHFLLNAITHRNVSRRQQITNSFVITFIVMNFLCNNPNAHTYHISGGRKN